MASLIHQELSDKVLGAMFKVHNYLGPGLLESAYEGALAIELKNQGLRFDRQAVYPLYYAGECAGAYIADLVVENTIILELKSVKSLSPAMTEPPSAPLSCPGAVPGGTCAAPMEAQLLNYLRLSSLPVGYLVNFRGTRLEWKRRVL
jgi:GxxExxY protein